MAYAVIFCLAFTVAVLAAPLVRALAVRVGAVDRPDGKRKIHAKPMPRLGGLVIVVAVVAASAAYFLMHRDVRSFIFTTPQKIAAFVAGLVIILGLGVYDDISPVRPRVKLLFQTLTVVVCFAAGLRVEFRFVTHPALATVLSFAATWFWLVACINSMNLVDGIDGLASGVVFFAGTVIFVVAALHAKIAVALAAAAVLGSVVGFLMYNWHPAVMFLGDSGSLLLGYLIATLAMAGSLKSHAAVALLVPILALGLPIMDTLLAILRRISRRLPISQADRDHIHHKLLAMGLSSREVVLVLYAACLTLAAGALIVASADFLLLAAFTLGLLCFGALLGIEFLGARHLSALLRRVFPLFCLRSRSCPPPKEITLLWLKHSQSLEDISLSLEPWLRSVGASAAIIRPADTKDGVLAKVRIRGTPASQRSLDCPIVLSSGRQFVLTLEGVSPRGFEVPSAIRDALARTLVRVEQGIRGVRTGRLVAPARYSRKVATT